MATHSSILAWRMPWTEEPDRLQSIGLQRVGIQLSDLYFHLYMCCLGFSSLGMWAQYLWRTGLVVPGMWDLLDPGTEPMSPALACGFCIPLSHEAGSPALLSVISNP